MKLVSSTKAKVGLLLLSTVFSAVLFIGGYELYKHKWYYRWKAGFDNFGWFNKITIPSPNPDLMWEYRPYGKFREIESNRFGFREQTLPAP